jgi:osmotically-inducible protein OsmY
MLFFGPSEEGTMEESSGSAKAVSTVEAIEDHPLPETLAEAEELAASIEQAVWRETGGRVRNLRVEVTGSEVLLTGRCNTYYAKQQAQHAAMGVRWDGTLTNRIEVR